MGYDTQFTGSVTVEPPLNGPEMDYLRRFAGSRRYQCTEGPYHADIDVDCNRHTGCVIIDINTSSLGQPGLWCKWEPTNDGTGIEWNGVEKFYDSAEWMQYLIDMFLKPGAVLQGELSARIPSRVYDQAFRHFTFNHVVNGRIEAQGDDPDDRWTLVVADNHVGQVKAATLADLLKADAAFRAAFEMLRDAGVTAAQYARQIGEVW